MEKQSPAIQAAVHVAPWSAKALGIEPARSVHGSPSSAPTAAANGECGAISAAVTTAKPWNVANHPTADCGNSVKLLIVRTYRLELRVVRVLKSPYCAALGLEIERRPNVVHDPSVVEEDLDRTVRRRQVGKGRIDTSAEPDPRVPEERPVQSHVRVHQLPGSPECGFTERRGNLRHRQGSVAFQLAQPDEVRRQRRWSPLDVAGHVRRRRHRNYGSLGLQDPS